MSSSENKPKIIMPKPGCPKYVAAKSRPPTKFIDGSEAAKPKKWMMPKPPPDADKTQTNKPAPGAKATIMTNLEEDSDDKSDVKLEQSKARNPRRGKPKPPADKKTHNEPAPSPKAETTPEEDDSDDKLRAQPAAKKTKTDKTASEAKTETQPKDDRSSDDKGEDEPASKGKGKGGKGEVPDPEANVTWGSLYCVFMDYETRIQKLEENAKTETERRRQHRKEKRKLEERITNLEKALASVQQAQQQRHQLNMRAYQRDERMVPTMMTASTKGSVGRVITKYSSSSKP